MSESIKPIARWGRILYVIFAIGLICVPVVASPYMMVIWILGLYMFLLAVSLDVTLGRLELLSLAVPGFLGVGAYTSALLSLNTKLGFVTSTILGGLTASVIGLGVGYIALRMSGHSFVIVTMAFTEILRQLCMNWVEVTRGAMGLPGINNPIINLGRFKIVINELPEYYYLALAFALVTIGIYLPIVRGRTGRTLRALGDNEVLTKSVGANPLHYKLLAVSSSALLAGLAGGFYSRYMRVVDPTLLGFSTMLPIIVIVTCGGAGNLRGIAAAALFVTILPEVLRFADSLRLVIYGLFLYIIAIFCPNGLVQALEDIVAKWRSRCPDE